MTDGMVRELTNGPTTINSNIYDSVTVVSDDFLASSNSGEEPGGMCDGFVPNCGIPQTIGYLLSFSVHVKRLGAAAVCILACSGED